MTRILFVSSRNAARSQLAAALLRELGGSAIKAYSCGVPGQIADQLSPVARQVLHKAGISSEGLKPKDWSTLVQPGAPKMDFVITLEGTLGLPLPLWPGQPEQALWHFPALEPGDTQAQQLTQATQMLYALQRRLELLVALHNKAGRPRELRDDLRDLARH